MLVLTRKQDEEISIAPTADFARELIGLLQPHCPNFKESDFEELGRALVMLKDHPIFQIIVTVVQCDRRRNNVRIGTTARKVWEILRAEMLDKAA